MGQDSTAIQKRRRGRPRQYDRDAVLDQAMRVFHQKGFAATSLDDLADAMGMNRPSLYNAFGNKESIYRLAFDNFRRLLRQGAAQVFACNATLDAALRGFYEAALDVYFYESPARGCFVFCTAPAEALSYEDIRADISAVLIEVDSMLAAQFERAKSEGRLAATVDCGARAQMAQAVLHSLALRARAGEPRKALQPMIDNAVAVLTA